MPCNKLRREGNTLSVRDIVSCYESFGIPHFQRAMVWGNDKKAAFLLSLYRKFPVGSIVLWSPKERREEIGRGLVSKEGYEFLVIDGQQRIRTIYDAFGKENREGEVLCFNIRNETFKFLSRDPKHYPDRSPYRTNWVPLREILKEGDEEEVKSRIRREYKIEEGVDKNIEDRINKINAMLEVRIPVQILIGEEYDLKKALLVYNAINSGGMKATKEELAYATLVEKYGKAEQKLRDCYEALYDEGTDVDRDTLLARKREQNLGFKFIIRILVLVLANEEIKKRKITSLGSRDLSFDFILKGKRLKELTEKEFEKAWDITKRILGEIKELLTGKENLCCDDFRFIPNSVTLLPFAQRCYQIFIQTESHERKTEEWEAEKHEWVKYLLRLYLSDVTQEDVMYLVNKIKNNELEDFRDILGLEEYSKERRGKEINRKIRNIEKLKRDIEKIKNSKISSRSKYKPEHFFFKVETPNNKYILLLYWLLRKRGAMDFDYAENDVRYTNSESNDYLQTPNEPISKEDSPQKSHLVPYSKFGVPDGEKISRSRHISWHIGNITYLSRTLNAGDDRKHIKGMEDNFPKLGREKERIVENSKIDNLTAHFIDDEFKRFIDNPEASGLLKLGKKDGKEEWIVDTQTFIEMCNRRGAKIGEAFCKWAFPDNMKD